MDEKADGSVEIRTVDADGVERAFAFRANSAGNLEIVVEDGNGNRNKVEIDPSGGSTSLGK